MMAGKPNFEWLTMTAGASSSPKGNHAILGRDHDTFQTRFRAAKRTLPASTRLTNGESNNSIAWHGLSEKMKRGAPNRLSQRLQDGSQSIL